MKKTLKIIGVTLLIVVLILIAVPFIFQSQIKDMVKNYINKNVNAQVEFSDVNLSLLKSFPQAHVTVSDLVITNFEPFQDETFATAKTIAFTMSVKELFKTADEAVIVNTIDVNEAVLTLRTDAFGNNNYDITKESENPADSSSTFTYDIKNYSINNSAFSYIDDKSKIEIFVSEFNHSGKGKFTDVISEFDTKSEANVSITIDSTNYLNNNHVKLDALIDLDIKNETYTFKENKALINQLPLEFQGYVQNLENGQNIDITFKNTGSSFKDFLAVIPETYSKNLETVETTGNFNVNGIIKGMMTEETIPNLDISIKSDNASFKYPNLPKRVENIIIDTSIKNETGNTDDTYVDIKMLNFKIDQDVFRSSAIIKNITGNMLVNADIDGTLNLANLTKAYPIELQNELSGILKAKINTAFDMNAVESNAYERIKAAGTANITNFVFTSDAMTHPLQISKADMTFNPSTVTLNSFSAKTGQSDISATGTINNFIGFLLSKKVNLKGNFNVNSNTLALNDFMSGTSKTTKDTASEKTKNTTTEALKIPEFLECTINANVNNVLYDNLTLKDVKGTLTVKDQQANLNDLTSKLFDGLLTVSGSVSTKSDTPSFNLSLIADKFDISKSFSNLELLQSLAPIAKVLQGKLNTTINITGALDKEFSPNLNTVTGSAFAELLTAKIEENEGVLLTQLGSALNFIDFSKLDLSDLKTTLEFANGEVKVKPFNLTYKDIGITVSGTHGFDQSMNYNAVFNVPAKYLGGEVNRLIGKINDNEVNKISIPITANIGGTFTNPKISTDLTSGVTSLTRQLIEIEKQKLLNTGKDKITDLLNGIITGNTSQTPTSSTTTTADSTKIKTDSINAPNPVNPIKDGIKDVLGGIIKNTKKKKDSVN